MSGTWRALLQDFDKLEGILKEYKNFLKESDSIDMNLPLHAHLAGFDEEGLKIAVHVRTPHPLHALPHTPLSICPLHDFLHPSLHASRTPKAHQIASYSRAAPQGCTTKCSLRYGCEDVATSRSDALDILDS